MDATVNRRGAVNFLEEVLLDVRPLIEQRYARELASISHRYDVDDLYQSVCVRAIRWIGRCKGESKEAVRNWVLKIAANVFRSAIATHKLSAKRSTNRERGTVATSGDEPHVEPWSEPVESVRLMVGEQCRHMRACIDRLPRSRQQILVMRFLEQRNYRQIAEELGVTIQAARTNVSQSVKQVRSEMNQRNLPGFE
jgi:RNA polymerase sigma-70 factor (ECF subfamily)